MLSSSLTEDDSSKYSSSSSGGAISDRRMVLSSYFSSLYDLNAQDNNEDLNNLTGQVKKSDSPGIDVRGFMEIHIGYYDGGTDIQPTKVIMKFLKLRELHLDEQLSEAVSKCLYRELRRLQNLQSKHVQKFLGIAYLPNVSKIPAIVSPYYEGENIYGFLTKKPESRLRMRLLLDVADGLAYLHTNNVVHGDLSSSNILINAEGSACLCDFGLSRVIEDATGKPFLASISESSNCRWMAPELLIPNKDGIIVARTSKESDIYSFGCVAYHVLTDRVPFYDIRDNALLVMMDRGSRIRKPDFDESGMRISEERWGYIQLCCAEDPLVRPTATSVLKTFMPLSNSITSKIP